LGGQSYREAARKTKVFTSINISDSLGHLLGITQKWLPFVDQEIEYFFWMKYAIFLKNHNSKAPYINNSQTFEAGQNEGYTFFTSCTLNKNTLGVPNNILYLQNVFKRYIV